MSEESHVAYQNKDIAAKYLAEHFSDKSFAAYGVKVPRIVECIKRCFDMAKQVEDEQDQVFILAGILVFADKVIDSEDSKKMREWIMMTKVSRLFEEEKIEYGKKVAAEAAEKAAEKAAKENETEIVKRMLSNEIPLEQVKAVVTILTEKEIKNLKKEITQ